MTQTIAEQALTRVLFYLESCGVALTHEACLQALQLVHDALLASPAQPMSRVMDELQQRFTIPPIEMAPPVPAINRGSIGYDIF